MTSTQTPMLLTVTAAAEVLGMSRSKLYELVARGDVESVRIGAALRVPAEALGEYVERLRTTANDSAA